MTELPRGRQAAQEHADLLARQCASLGTFGPEHPLTIEAVNLLTRIKAANDSWQPPQPTQEQEPTSAPSREVAGSLETQTAHPSRIHNRPQGEEGQT